MTLIDSFLDYLLYERNYSKATIRNYKADLSDFEEFVKRECGEEYVGLEDVKADVVRDWMMSLMDRGVVATTVNTRLSSLRTFYKFLIRRGKMAENPMLKISGPKKRKTLPVFLKESEMDRLLDDTDFGTDYVGCRDRMIIEMFYTTGMRLSELIGLDDRDIDFDTSLIKVTGKRNKQRLIPFDDALKHSMMNYINVRRETFPEHEGAFFVGKKGARLYKGLVEKVVKESLAKVTAVKKKSPHVLRHTFATSMLNHEADLGAIKELLGHESLATTEIYTHTTFEELKKVYKQAHPRA